MKLSQGTSTKLIILDKKVTCKDEAFKLLASKFFDEGVISSKKEFIKAVYTREKESPTGLENGIAIPHGKSSTVKKAQFAILRTLNPIEDYKSLKENNKVKLIFMMAIPENGSEEHLDVLSTLATKLINQQYRQKIMMAKTPEEIISLLDNTNDTNLIQSPIENNKDSYVAVTACAAGIAHTYMAAEALVTEANKENISMYVEKQGAKGVENRLTDKQIQNAKAVILAHDVTLNGTDRFKGKPILDIPVAEPIKNAHDVISKAKEISKNYKFTKNNVANNTLNLKKNWKTEIKDSVLTGISYIIPIIIAGGMISAITMLIVQLFGLQALSKNPTSWISLLKALGGNLLSVLMIPILSAYMAYSIADKPALGPGFAGGLAANMISSGFLGGMLSGLIAGYLMKWMKKNIHTDGAFSGVITFWLYPVVGSLITGCLMLFLVGKPIAWLNSSLINWLNNLAGTNAILLGAIIGCMVSFDLGGPVNKAAYAFCLGAMANGNFVPYCVFASTKMVSAFTTSLVCLLKKDLVTSEERKIGNQTWILGLAGITEGAIPFAMADPVRVIFSYVIGSAVTGAIVMYYSIGLNVPGAGIFSMLFLKNGVSAWLNPIIWLVAALIGTLISTIILIFLKTKRRNKNA